MEEKTNKQIKGFKGAACGLALALVTGLTCFAPTAEGAALAGETGRADRAYAEARSAGEPGEKVPVWLAGPGGGSREEAARLAKAEPSLYLEEIEGGARGNYLAAKETLAAAWDRLQAKEPERRTVDPAVRSGYVTAIKAINRSLAAEPRYWRSYALGSLIYRGYGGIGQAERYAGQALALLRMRLERDEGDVWAHLALAVMGLAGEGHFWPEGEPTARREAERVLELCGYGAPLENGAAYRLPDIPVKNFFPNFDTSRPMSGAKRLLSGGDRAFCGFIAALALGDDRSKALAGAVQSHSAASSSLSALALEGRKAAELDGAAGGKGEHTRAFLLKCLLALPEEIGLGK